MLCPYLRSPRPYRGRVRLGSSARSSTSSTNLEPCVPLSFGISVHDTEEVTQELFLAVFRHSQLGRCRCSLRDRIFRVARNHALKRRTAIQRARDTIESDGGRPASVTHHPAR